MKLTIPLGSMIYAANMALKFAAPASDIAELRCLKLVAETGGDKLTLTAFNRSMWLVLKVAGAEVREGGECLIPAAELRRWIVAGSETHPLGLIVKGGRVELENGKATCKIDTLDVEKYPDPALTGRDPTYLTMKASDLAKGLSRSLFASGTSDTDARSRIDATLIDIEDGSIGIIGTDGKVISVSKTPADVHGVPIAEMIPRATAGAMLPVLESMGDGDIRVSLSKGEFVVETERFEVGSRLIEGSKFNWRKVLQAWDKDRPEKIKIPPKEFLAAIRQASAADPANLRMELAFNGETAEFSVGEKSVSEIFLKDCTHTMDFAFDWEYLVSLFNMVVRSDAPVTLEWGINDARNQSIIFRVGDDWRVMGVPLVRRQQ